MVTAPPLTLWPLACSPLPPDGVLVPIPATLDIFASAALTRPSLLPGTSRAAAVCQSPLFLPVPVSTTKGSDKATRHAAMSDALSATRPIYGSVILIDDVLTTGATMSVASRLLMQAGAESVCGIALAKHKKKVNHLIPLLYRGSMINMSDFPEEIPLSTRFLCEQTDPDLFLDEAKIEVTSGWQSLFVAGVATL